MTRAQARQAREMEALLCQCGFDPKGQGHPGKVSGEDTGQICAPSSVFVYTMYHTSHGVCEGVKRVAL